MDESALEIAMNQAFHRCLYDPINGRAPRDKVIRSRYAALIGYMNSIIAELEKTAPEEVVNKLVSETNKWKPMYE